MPLGPGAMRDSHFDGYYALPAEIRLDWIQRWCPSGRFLEVGPGPGHLLAAARRRGFEVSGVDPNPASVRRIREQLGIDIELATIEQSELPDRAFDVIAHVDLLSHLEDPVVALRAMTRRLAPGGHVCFEVGIQGGVSPLWYHATGSLGLPDHRWFFSRGALERVLLRSGLRLVGLQRFGLAPAVGLLVLKRMIGPLALRIAGNPYDPNGLPPQQNAPHRLYDRLMYFLRYHVGRFAPEIGPQTVFVAASALDGA